MQWKVDFNDLAERDMLKLDRTVRARIYRFFHERVEHLDDPKALAEPLSGEFRGLHRFRIGDYRAICNIQRGILTVWWSKLDTAVQSTEKDRKKTNAPQKRHR